MLSSKLRAATLWRLVSRPHKDDRTRFEFASPLLLSSSICHLLLPPTFETHPTQPAPPVPRRTHDAETTAATNVFLVSFRIEQAQLENARRDGLSPNLINYNACVDVCAKTGEVDRALALLEQMQTSGDPGLTPDLVT